MGVEGLEPVIRHWSGKEGLEASERLAGRERHGREEEDRVEEEAPMDQKHTVRRNSKKQEAVPQWNKLLSPRSAQSRPVAYN